MTKRFYLILLICCFYLNKSNAQQFNFTNYTINNGLPSNTINASSIDDIGYVWFATDKGVVKFDGLFFSEISNLETTALFTSKWLKLLGHKNGLTIIRNNKQTFIKSREILNFYEKDKIIYVSTTEGVFQFKDNNLAPIEINSVLDFSIIRDIFFNAGNFYISSNSGLWKIDNLKNPNSIKQILKDDITTIVKSKNKFVAATSKNEIIVLENDKIEKSFTSLKNISDLAIINQNLWISSFTDGIDIRDLETFSFVKTISKYNNLNTNQINSVIKSENLTLINTLNKGTYITGYQLYKKIKEIILYFEDFYVNGNSTNNLLQSKKSIVLNPDQNNISFIYKTIDLENPNKVKYQYTLNGTPSNWTSNNELQLPNLNFGKYKLKVQSKIDELKSPIQVLNFEIATPFYKKDEFYLIVAVLLLTAGYLTLDLYLKNLNRRHNKEVNELKLKNHLLTLEQQALQLQMNPHFIFNVLNGIKSLGNKGNVNELNRTINQFAILLRSVLNNSRKEEITLKEELTTIVNYIELEQRMSSKTFNYTIDLQLSNIDSDEILFPSMLLQPFIENAIAHGFTNDKEGLLTIAIRLINNFLEITIEDNGIGIDKSLKNKSTTNNNSLALKVTKERIQYLSTLNKFNITTIKTKENTTGTRVFFQLPLKTEY
ncbi:sensor histidine kinase [Polaribacter sp. P097]|uniref:sensor histidine kinase n=1 Tax=Polaribacter sp. P097 TaxID=3117398 RepID=UPI002FE1501A